MADSLMAGVLKRSPWVGAGLAGAAAYWLLSNNARRIRELTFEPVVTTGPRIVILGSGFAGLSLAKRLRHHLKKTGQITLVDRHNYQLFTPLLSQVSACGLPPTDVAFPIREVSGRHGIVFHKATVQKIDLQGRKVALDDGEVEYDYLVVALGSTNNYFHNESAEKYALPMKTLEDGFTIRNRVLDALERATKTDDLAERRKLLTFVVVGGGPSGVETTAALADLIDEVIPVNYRLLKHNDARVIIIQSEDKLVGNMGSRISSRALDHLHRAGVEVWLNSEAKEIRPDGVTTEDGKSVDTYTVIWATGVRIPDVIAKLENVEHGKGGSLEVDEFLQVKGYPGVYSVGDCASIIDAKTGEHVPLLAQAAVQEGDVAAENIARAIAGKPQAPFHFRKLGDALLLGGAAGAIKLPWAVLDGGIGWLGWWLFHLYRERGFRDKLVTGLDWGIGYVYDPDTARLELQAGLSTEPAWSAAHG